MSDALDQHHIRAIEALNDRIAELEDGIRGLLALRPSPNNPSRYCCWRYGSDSEQGSHMPQHADNCPYQRAKALLPEDDRE